MKGSFLAIAIFILIYNYHYFAFARQFPSQVVAPGALNAPAFAHTYSIVAYDPATNQMGVAVQSHWFSVGQVVPWAEPGVGVVATQSLVEVSYGRLGLELMRAGKSAHQALKALLAADPNPDVRQVAMIDKDGNLAVHTGKKCIPEAGHITSSEMPTRDGAAFSCQANLMLRNTVPQAMAKAFSEAEGDLAERLLSALFAAEAEGGDIRGKQSAALIVVAIKPTGDYSNDYIYDIRVDDSPAPLPELERLLKVARAYRTLNTAAQYIYEGKLKEAEAEYQKMRELQAENAELIFWFAQTLIEVATAEPPKAEELSLEKPSPPSPWVPTAEERKKLISMSLPIFGECFRLDPSWRETLRRLVKVELFPKDDALISKILAQGK